MRQWVYYGHRSSTLVNGTPALQGFLLLPNIAIALYIKNRLLRRSHEAGTFHRKAGWRTRYRTELYFNLSSTPVPISVVLTLVYLLFLRPYPWILNTENSIKLFFHQFHYTAVSSCAPYTIPGSTSSWFNVSQPASQTDRAEHVEGAGEAVSFNDGSIVKSISVNIGFRARQLALSIRTSRSCSYDSGDLSFLLE